MKFYKSVEDVPEDRFLETLLNESEECDENDPDGDSDEFADEDDGLDFPADE